MKNKTEYYYSDKYLNTSEQSFLRMEKEVQSIVNAKFEFSTKYQDEKNRRNFLKFGNKITKGTC